MNAKKQARRTAAAKRFRILSLNDYVKQKCSTQQTASAKFWAWLNAEGAHEQKYAAYVAAKNAERIALGL